jgi:hypothetical protein
VQRQYIYSLYMINLDYTTLETMMLCSRLLLTTEEQQNLTSTAGFDKTNILPSACTVKFLNALHTQLYLGRCCYKLLQFDENH